eukprot:6477999-Amphidinium_carterae.1
MGRAHWGVAREACRELGWQHVSGEGNQCVWRSMHWHLAALQMPEAALDVAGLKTELLQSIEDNLQDFTLAVGGVEDAVRRDLDSMRQPGNMANDRAVLALALFKGVPCLVLDAALKAAWVYVPANQVTQKMAVYWMEHEHFWPCQGFLEMRCLWFREVTPDRYQAGRSLREVRWRLASANGGGWAPVQRQLEGWKDLDCMPQVLCVQEHRLSPHRRGDAIAWASRLGYNAFLGESLWGRGGGPVCGVGVLVKKVVAARSLPGPGGVLAGRVQAVLANMLFPQGVVLVSVYLDVTHNADLLWREVAALMHYVGSLRRPYIILGDWNATPAELADLNVWAIFRCVPWRTGQ